MGCFRQRELIELTLREFFKQTGKNYFQQDYHLFAVITYLALFRLEELGFEQFRRFVFCCNASGMTRFVAFLFNPVVIEDHLKPKWVTILDHEYVQTHLINPIIHHMHLVEPFLQELIDLTTNGQQVVKPREAKEIGFLD